MRLPCAPRVRCALVALPLLSARLAAQTVMGRVVDSAAHRPVAGLTVRLIAALDSARDTVVARTQTAPDGAFLLNAPKPGTYRVRLGDAHIGPPLTLANVDAEDQHEYVLAPTPPAATAPGYHVLHGAELDSATSGTTPLLACQVEHQAALVPGTVAMRFPFHRPEGTPNGSLLAEFVVDTLAHLDRSTLRVSRSPETDAAFVKAVEDGLKKAQFSAAITDGRRVRQRMYVPVLFRWGSTDTPPVLHGSPCGPTGDVSPVMVTTGWGGGPVR